MIKDEEKIVKSNQLKVVELGLYYPDGRIRGKRVETQINGVVVEGEIVRQDPHYISVRILSPYYGISCSAVWGRIPRSYTFESEYGDKTAVDLLTDCYEICDRIEKNIDQLKHQYKVAKGSFNSLVKKSRFKVSQVQAMIRDARRELKEKKLKQMEYQTRLSLLKEIQLQLEKEVRAYWKYFFLQIFKRRRRWRSENELREYIERKIWEQSQGK